jgi:hypothetical protein
MHSLALALTIAVFGDAPYGTTPTDNAEFLATPFEDPLVYTPGDNEWADCHKSTEGGSALSASVAEAAPYQTSASLLDPPGRLTATNKTPPCTEAYDRSIFDLWKSLHHPIRQPPSND